METIIDRSTLEELRTGLRGGVYAPSEQGYDEARNRPTHKAVDTWLS